MGFEAPDARDGLTPHSRVMLSNLAAFLPTERGYFTKTYKLLESVRSRRPDRSLPELYSILLRLVRPWVCRYPLLDNQGHVGSIDGDLPAGIRFNEMRFTRFGEAMLGGNDADQPTPSAFPHLLCNGGWAHSGRLRTEPTRDAQALGKPPFEDKDLVPRDEREGGEVLAFVPPHNLKEVAGALAALLARPGASLDDILKVLPAPDFPTGGWMAPDAGFRDLYETGTGSIVVRARTALEEGRNGKTLIVISEIPYGVTTTRIIEDVAHRVRAGAEVGITDIKDLSNREDLRVEIEVGPRIDASAILKALMASTSLQNRLDFKMTTRRGSETRDVGLMDLLRSHLEHRLESLGRAKSSRSETILLKELERWSRIRGPRRTSLGPGKNGSASK